MAVVFLHAAAWSWYQVPVDSMEWQILNLMDGAVRFGVPVFFMVSGAMFLDPARNITLRLILKKYLPRIVIPYFAWSALYAGLTTYSPAGDHSFLGFLQRTIVGHYHLWFLIALAGLYLATPLLRASTKDRALGWYFVILAFFFATVLPLFAQVPFIGSTITEILEKAQFQLPLGYSIFFILGHLLHTAHISIRVRYVLLLAGAVGIIATVLGSSLLSLAQGSGNGRLYDNLTPNVLAVAVAVFVVVKPRPDAGPQNRTALPLRLLGTYSFGIYLVHPMFQTLYQQWGFSALSTTPVLGVPLLTCAILFPSLAVTALLRRIPRAGTYLT